MPLRRQINTAIQRNNQISVWRFFVLFFGGGLLTHSLLSDCFLLRVSARVPRREAGGTSRDFACAAGFEQSVLISLS